MTLSTQTQLWVRGQTRVQAACFSHFFCKALTYPFYSCSQKKSLLAGVGSGLSQSWWSPCCQWNNESLIRAPPQDVNIWPCHICWLSPSSGQSFRFWYQTAEWEHCWVGLWWCPSHEWIVPVHSSRPHSSCTKHEPNISCRLGTVRYQCEHLDYVTCALPWLGQQSWMLSWVREGVLKLPPLLNSDANSGRK